MKHTIKSVAALRKSLRTVKHENVTMRVSDVTFCPHHGALVYFADAAELNGREKYLADRG